MRSILFTLVFCVACATTGSPKYVNVAAVRSEINGTIRSQENDRAIHSMGKVEAQRAVVYTTSKDGVKKQEELWVKDGAKWKLENATALNQQ